MIICAFPRHLRQENATPALHRSRHRGGRRPDNCETTEQSKAFQALLCLALRVYTCAPQTKQPQQQLHSVAGARGAAMSTDIGLPSRKGAAHFTFSRSTTCLGLRARHVLWLSGCQTHPPQATNLPKLQHREIHGGSATYPVAESATKDTKQIPLCPPAVVQNLIKFSRKMVITPAPQRQKQIARGKIRQQMSDGSGDMQRS